MTAQNPFAPSDAERHAIWDVLVRRDSEFFLSGDWSLVADDYVEFGFLGIDAGGHSDPSLWKIGYPRLENYRNAAIGGRLKQADFVEDLRDAWFRCQSLDRIDVAGDIAVAHKRIRGDIERTDRSSLELNWQSIFFMRRVQAKWKITGFIGYLPP
jgi:hypothetical protein